MDHEQVLTMWAGFIRLEASLQEGYCGKSNIPLLFHKMWRIFDSMIISCQKRTLLLEIQ